MKTNLRIIKFMKFKKIILIYLGVISLLFVVACKKIEEDEPIDYNNIRLMVAKEDFYYITSSDMENKTPAFNILIRSNAKFKVEDIKNIQLPEVDEKIYIKGPTLADIEINKNYFYTFTLEFDKVLPKEIKADKLKFDLFDKTYILPIGTRTIKIIREEDYDSKNVMLGPMFYQTYKAITEFSKYYTINLGNDKNDIIYIKEISLMNKKIKLENLIVDNTKIDGNFEIKPGMVHKIMIEFSNNDDFIYFTLQPQIKFTYNNKDYEQYLPPSYIGHLGMEKVLERLASKEME